MFPTTSWTLIDQLKDPQRRDMALGLISERYRNALAIYASRMCTLMNVHGHDPEDLVQGFYAFLIDKALLEKSVRDEKQRFRNWLLTVFKNYFRNETRSARGRAKIVPLDPNIDPADNAKAESDYERQWAADLLTQARDLHKQRFGNDPAYEIYVASLRDGLTIKAICDRYGKSKSQVETILKKITEGFQTILRNLLVNELEYPNEHELRIEQKHLKALLKDDSVKP